MQRKEFYQKKIPNLLFYFFLEVYHFGLDTKLVKPEHTKTYGGLMVTIHPSKNFKMWNGRP